MSRSVSWRHMISDAASWHQDQALGATIYILRETGPTGFLLKEEGEAKKVKVFLGDPHSCTCSVFTKEKDLCKHICWVLLKKFRLPRENPIAHQLGLVEREINQLLRGLNQKSRDGGVASRTPRRSALAGSQGVATTDNHRRCNGRDMLEQRQITEDDVCPICQDEMLNARQPVTYCRYGCAKSIHIKCMKVWAEHQKSLGEVSIRCPLCREDFGQLELLQAEYRNSSLQKTRSDRLDVHSGVSCGSCNRSPIQGKCYRCSECFDYSLCHTCFITNVHIEHSFKFRQKPSQRWRPAQRGSGAAFPQAVVNDLIAREISDGDYDLLLQLDSQTANQPSNIPESVIRSFPLETVRPSGALLNPGVQCRVCLMGYTVGQSVRRLPCRHKFHSTCIDPWLLHQHPTCPVDGSVVWHPSARRDRPKRQSAKESQETLPDIGVTAVNLNGRFGDGVAGQRRRGKLHDERLRSTNGDDVDVTSLNLIGLRITTYEPSPSISVHQTHPPTHGNPPIVMDDSRAQCSSEAPQHQLNHQHRCNDLQIPANRSIHRKPPHPPHQVDQFSAPSIPLVRESRMTPIGNSRHQSSSSAPTLGQRRSPLGSITQPSLQNASPTATRGRPLARDRRSVSATRATGTLGAERKHFRNGSTERLCPTDVDKQQLLENLFIGSSSYQQPSSAGVSSKGHRSSPLRSRVSQFHPDLRLVEGISGNAVNPPM